MSVLVFIDIADGEVKKASYEACFYGSKLGDAIGIALGEISHDKLAELGQYGLSKVLHVHDARFNNYDSKVYAKAIAEAAESNGCNTVVCAFNQRGKSLGARVAVRLEAGFVPGASSLLENDTVSRGVYSGKAKANISFTSEKKVIAVNGNTLQVAKTDAAAAVEDFAPAVADSDFAITVKSVDKVSGSVPLTEADIVVSAGRGLKGPENWGMIQDLADLLGAATACSRPVADVGWRPHHEHVGQTGVTVRPNLYFAIGISGAIQHLAGVNQSKTMVVINNDPEAPFFKAADYGIVGDAFEVVPKLVEAIKNFKAANN